MGGDSIADRLVRERTKAPAARLVRVKFLYAIASGRTERGGLSPPFCLSFPAFRETSLKDRSGRAEGGGGAGG